MHNPHTHVLTQVGKAYLGASYPDWKQPQTQQFDHVYKDNNTTCASPTGDRMCWERDARMSTHPFAMRHERKCSRAVAPCTLPGLGRLTISARQTRSMSWIGKVLDEQPAPRVSRWRSSSERRRCGLCTPIVSTQPDLLFPEDKRVKQTQECTCAGAFVVPRCCGVLLD